MRQEDGRKRLADAFSAMSAYIQRYRCQESEFDLGAALMNPMADCEQRDANAFVMQKRRSIFTFFVFSGVMAVMFFFVLL